MMRTWRSALHDTTQGLAFAGLPAALRLARDRTIRHLSSGRQYAARPDRGATLDAGRDAADRSRTRTGLGACWLRDAEIATLTQETLLHFDGERYCLLAWCIMPNHVHVVVETLEGHTLSDVVKSWTSFTSRQANSRLGR